MPNVTPGASAVAGTVGQSLSLEFGIDTPGGTFTSQNLPAALTLNPVSGMVQGAQKLAFSGGTPVLTVLGTPGLEYVIQAKKTLGLGSESRWVTLATRTQNDAAGVEWMDSEASGTGQRLYRIVWVP